MRSFSLRTLTLLLCCPALPAFSEEPANAAPPTPRDYRVDLVVNELSGDRKVDAHAYFLTLRERDTGKLRVGSNIPMATQTGGASSAVMRHDVGMDLDCRVEEQGGSALLSLKVELTTLLGPAKGTAPVIHKLHWSTVSLIPFDRPAVITSADDVTSKRTYQLEVTVTRLK
jgi:hypothetical protein